MFYCYILIRKGSSNEYYIYNYAPKYSNSEAYHIRRKRIIVDLKKESRVWARRLPVTPVCITT
jgi:hypothetical protein